MSAASPPHRQVAVLDIGSNSVRFVVYALFGASFVSVYNEKVLAGLGRDLRDTGCLSPGGRMETLAALRRFKRVADARRLPVLVGATAALREAADAPDFVEEVARETGLHIAPVSGAGEARLSALGVLAGEPRATGLACDLGGASLEIVPVDPSGPGQGVSLPLGPFPVVGDQLREADPNQFRSHVDAALADLDIAGAPTLHLIGGAWRNLALIHQSCTDYPLGILHGYEVSAGPMADFCAWAAGEGRAQVLDWGGIGERRRETLPYGALVLECLIRRIGPERVRVSATGLREGLVAEHLGL